MTEAEIRALKLGEPLHDVAAKPDIRISEYPVINFRNDVAGLISRERAGDRWRFKSNEYLSSFFDTPEEALEGLKKWMLARAQS